MSFSCLVNPNTAVNFKRMDASSGHDTVAAFLDTYLDVSNEVDSESDVYYSNELSQPRFTSATNERTNPNLHFNTPPPVQVQPPPKRIVKSDPHVYEKPTPISKPSPVSQLNAEQKLKRRRAQVAEASRTARAKKKQKMIRLQRENNQLRNAMEQMQLKIDELLKEKFCKITDELHEVNQRMDTLNSKMKEIKKH